MLGLKFRCNIMEACNLAAINEKKSRSSRKNLSNDFHYWIESWRSFRVFSCMPNFWYSLNETKIFFAFHEVKIWNSFIILFVKGVKLRKLLRDFKLFNYIIKLLIPSSDLHQVPQKRKRFSINNLLKVFFFNQTAIFLSKISIKFWRIRVACHWILSQLFLERLFRCNFVSASGPFTAPAYLQLEGSRNQFLKSIKRFEFSFRFERNVYVV